MCKYCVHRYLRRFVRVLGSYTGFVRTMVQPFSVCRVNLKLRSSARSQGPTRRRAPTELPTLIEAP